MITCKTAKYLVENVLESYTGYYNSDHCRYSPLIYVTSRKLLISSFPPKLTKLAISNNALLKNINMPDTITDLNIECRDISGYTLPQYLMKLSIPYSDTHTDMTTFTDLQDLTITWSNGLVMIPCNLTRLCFSKGWRKTIDSESLPVHRFGSR